MKQIIIIVKNDLKVMLTDKMFLFWTVLLPILFITIFGNINYSGSQSPKAQLHILNKDKGEWGDRLINYLNSNALKIVQTETFPEKYNRILTIPEDFSSKFSSNEPQTIQFTKAAGKNMSAALQAEIRIIQSIGKIFCDKILNPDAKIPAEIVKSYKELIDIDSAFVQKEGVKIPSGADHAVPGVIVQFIMLSILIYGGITIMTDRTSGIMERVLQSPVTVTQLWIGKLIYRVLLGCFQGAVLIVVGVIFFNMNLGNIFYSTINVVLFSTAISALSLLLGSVISKEEIIIGIAVLCSNIFAALSGCWWPIEIVSGFMRDIATILPSYWAMDAFHKIVFFGTNASELVPNFLIMICFTLLFGFLSIKFFKIRS